MPFVVLKFMFTCLYELFDLSSKVGSCRGRVVGVEHRGVAAPSAGRMP
jgi:hypothetical protein